MLPVAVVLSSDDNAVRYVWITSCLPIMRYMAHG